MERPGALGRGGSSRRTRSSRRSTSTRSSPTSSSPSSRSPRARTCGSPRSSSSATPTSASSTRSRGAVEDLAHVKLNSSLTSNTGWGWNVGILFKPLSNIGIGAAYRSKITVNYDGTALFTQRFTGNPVVDGLVAPAAPAGRAPGDDVGRVPGEPQHGRGHRVRVRFPAGARGRLDGVVQLRRAEHPLSGRRRAGPRPDHRLEGQLGLSRRPGEEVPERVGRPRRLLLRQHAAAREGRRADPGGQRPQRVHGGVRLQHPGVGRRRRRGLHRLQAAIGPDRIDRQFLRPLLGSRVGRDREPSGSRSEQGESHDQEPDSLDRARGFPGGSVRRARAGAIQQVRGAGRQPGRGRRIELRRGTLSAAVLGASRGEPARRRVPAAAVQRGGGDESADGLPVPGPGPERDVDHGRRRLATGRQSEQPARPGLRQSRVQRIAAHQGLRRSEDDGPRAIGPGQQGRRRPAQLRGMSLRGSERRRRGEFAGSGPRRILGREQRRPGCARRRRGDRGRDADPDRRVHGEVRGGDRGAVRARTHARRLQHPGRRGDPLRDDDSAGRRGSGDPTARPDRRRPRSASGSGRRRLSL